MKRPLKPKSVRLEASTLCQLKCPTCPVTQGEVAKTLGSGFLKAADFRRFLDMNPFVREIELSNYGEIFLNPELMDILKAAFDKNVILRADNGVNLNTVSDQVLDSLVRYGLRSMTCSIDGASQETYAAYRKQGNFETVIGNIMKLNAFKKARGSRFPILTWQFVIFGHNEKEIGKARELATEMDMDFRLKASWDDSYSPVENPERAGAELFLSTTAHRDYSRERSIYYMQQFCHQLWEQPQVNWDGRMLGCCCNFWGDFGSGVFTQGFISVMSGDKMSYAREMLQGRKPAREDIPCTKCPLYAAVRRDGKWLKRGIRRKAFLFSRYVFRRLRIRRTLQKLRLFFKRAE